MNTNEEITKFLNVLREIGLLTHINDAEIASAIASANEEATRWGRPIHLLYTLPNTVCVFDSEYWWDPSVGESYLNLITDLSNLSRGQFQPTNLTFSPSPEEEKLLDWYNYEMTFSLSFVFGGRTYHQAVMYAGDWIDLSLIDIMNNALADMGREGRYHWIDTNDQMVVVIFLTDAQYSVLKENYEPNLKKWHEIYIDLAD